MGYLEKLIKYLKIQNSDVKYICIPIIEEMIDNLINYFIKVGFLRILTHSSILIEF